MPKRRRFTAQLSWLTPALAGGAREKKLVCMSRAERLALLEKEGSEMPLKT
jgi:hypothetical protein